MLESYPNRVNVLCHKCGKPCRYDVYMRMSDALLFISHFEIILFRYFSVLGMLIEITAI